MAAYTGTFPESLFYWEALSTPALNFILWRANGDADLRWTPPNQEFETYEIQRSTNGGSTWGSIVSFSTYDILGPWHRRVETGLTRGTTYTWRIRAVNPEGPSAWSNNFTSTCKVAASQPEDLVATPGDGTVTLTWDPPLDDGGSPIYYYAVWVSLADEDDWTNVTWDVPWENRFSPWTVTGLTNDTAYDFRVQARKEGMDESGNTTYATVTATPIIGFQFPPPGYADISFGARLNELAGTVGETPTTAANVLAGTTGESLTTALNIAAGTTGESATTALNILAGTTGEPAAEAARKIGSSNDNVG